MVELFGFRIERPKKDEAAYHHLLPPLLMMAPSTWPVVVSLDIF